MKFKGAKFKVISCLIAALISLNASSIAVAAQKNNETIDIDSRISNVAGHRYIYAQVGKGSITNDSNSELSYDGGWVLTNIAGKGALRCKVGNTENLFITPKSSYWTENDGCKVAVTVEYYDSDDASFSILYATKDVDSGNLMGTVVTEGTNVWKTKTFYIDDYTTRGNIRIVAPAWQISGLGKKDVYIGSIFVEENKTEHPVEITPSNGTRGLIYDYGASNSMTLNYDNFSGKNFVSVQTKYTIRNNEGTVLNTGEINSFSINNGATITKSINTGVTSCGTFTISFDVKTIDSNGVYRMYTDVADFSVVRTVASGSGRHDLIGVTADLRGYQQDNLSSVKGISKIGISKFKAASYWDEVEKTQNTYTYNNLTLTCDSYLQTQGIDTIYVATQIPSFYNGGESNIYYTTDSTALAAYGRYVVNLVEETGATEVEILNEINHSGYNANWSDMLYVGYAKYVKAAYDALHNNGHSDVKVIAGALAGADTSWAGKFKSRTTAVSSTLNYFDEFSYHTYYYGGFDAKDFADNIDAIYNAIGKPIIISEMGWSSADDSETTANGVKMYQKASYIPEALLIAQSKPTKVKGVYLYTLSEWGDYDKVRDYKFGLMKSPSGNGATDAYVSLGAFCNFFYDATIKGQINKNSYETVAMEFTRSGKSNIAALWTSKESGDKLAIDLGCSSITMYDMYGTPKGEIKSSNGVYSFDLSEELIYIEGNFTKFTESTSVISQNNSIVNTSANDDFAVTLMDSDSRTLDVELDYNKDVLSIEAPAKMANGSLTLNGISGTESGRYHVGIKLSEGNDTYYIGSAIVEIDAEEQGTRSATTVSGAAASYDESTRIATIAGQIHNYGPNDNVTVLVQSDENSSIAYVNQIKLIDSNLLTQFKMPDDADGTYTVKICGNWFNSPVSLTETKLYVEDTGENSRVTTITGGVSIYEKSTGIVTINGTLNDWKNKDKLTFLVTEDGFTGSEYSKIKFISQVNLENSSLNYQFRMPDGSAGHYNVFVCGDKFGGSRFGLGFNTENTAYITGFDISEDDSITAVANAQNAFDESKNVVIFIAQYDDNGSVVALNSSNTTIAANTVTMTPCSCSASRHANASKVVAYAWDSMNGLYPLIKDVELN